MQKTTRTLLFLFIAFLLLSCGRTQEQKSYLTGLKRVESTQQIHLFNDFILPRKKIDLSDRYNKGAGQGKYAKVMESDAGSFYLALHPEFYIDETDVGGVFLTNDKDPKLFIWSSWYSGTEKFLRNLRNPDFVKGLDKPFKSERIKIHTKYPIQADRYELL